MSIFQEKIFKSLFVKISLNSNTNIIIGNIYWSPSQPNGLTPAEQLDNFIEILSNILDRLNEQNCKVYLVGDFNINLLKFGTHPKTCEVIDKLISNFHCWTNNISCSYKSALINIYISDHFPIFHFILAKKIRQSPITFIKRDFSAKNIEIFKDDSLLNICQFSQHPWNELRK